MCPLYPCGDRARQSPDPPPMTIAAGTLLGRYEVRSQIGAGGMGEVYLAQDTDLDRKVALKLLPAEFTQQDHMWKQQSRRVTQ